MKYKNISRNIRTLREAYGETQLELSLVIGTTTSTISNYENGIRIPKPSILKKIATHYLITEDELVNGEIPISDFSSFPFEDFQKMLQMSLDIFPIICTDEALADPFFKKGYEEHIRIFEIINSDDFDSEGDPDVCIKAYVESINRNKTHESRANLVWWYIFLGMFRKNEQYFHGIDELRRKKISKHDFIKDYFLFNADEDYYEDDTKHQKTESRKNWSRYTKAITHLLGVLKTSEKWSDLAYYYLALEYMLCIVDNELSDSINRSIGIEMLSAYESLGNKYVNCMADAIMKLFDE